MIIINRVEGVVDIKLIIFEGQGKQKDGLSLNQVVNALVLGVSVSKLLDVVAK